MPILHNINNLIHVILQLLFSLKISWNAYVVYESESESRSVVSNSLQPHGL